MGDILYQSIHYLERERDRLRAAVLELSEKLAEAYDGVRLDADAELAAKLHGALVAWFEGNPERYLDGDYEGATIRLRLLAEDIAGMLLKDTAVQKDGHPFGEHLDCEMCERYEAWMSHWRDSDG